MRILIFGDSIAQGFYGKNGGWVQMLASELHEKTLRSMLDGGDYYTEVHNLGVSGDTVEGVKSRYKNEIEARRLYEENEVYIIAVGINNAVLAENIPLIDVYEFQEQLEEVISGLKELGGRVVCVGLTAVDESLTNPWAYSSKENQWLNNRVDLFEDTIKQSAGRLEVDFIPVHDEFIKSLNEGKHLLADGLHPNDAGHHLIYQIVKPRLSDLF